MTAHIQCGWFFEKSLQQALLLNKPLFTKKNTYLTKTNTDPYIVLVISSYKYILTYAEKQRFYLAWVLKKVPNHLFHF